MENNGEFKPREPDFKGDGIAVWVNLDKNGQKYLSVKVLGSLKINAFKNEPKPKPQPQSADL